MIKLTTIPFIKKWEPCSTNATSAITGTIGGSYKEKLCHELGWRLFNKDYIRQNFDKTPLFNVHSSIIE